MTSTPKKLPFISDANSKRQRHESQTSCTSIDELKVAFQGDERFENFGFDSPTTDVLSLSRENISIIILGPAVWQDAEKFKPFLLNSSKPNITLMCCGAEADLAIFAENNVAPDVHLLPLPINLCHLEFHIKSQFKSKKYHNTVAEDARRSDETNRNVKHILSISRELNGVRNVNKLLGLILEKAREATAADAGSIYVVEQPHEDKESSLVFKVSQNASVPQNLTEFRLPISDKSIVGNAVIHETSINIPDLHKLSENPRENPYNFKHDTSWEKRIGYECHSMLTLPMFDISGAVIGVIQLINCKKGNDPLVSPKDFVERTQAFDETTVEYAEIVAHQAGIALENALLTEEKQALFEGFVEASVNAIEQRDPTTSGHSHRVAKLTLGLAHQVNATKTGPYKDINLNEKRMKEIEFASLLHDFGKISVREQVLLKAKKLYPWEMDLLLERWELIRARHEIDYLNDLVNYLQTPNLFPPGLSAEHFSREKEVRLQKLEEFLDFITKVNEPTVLEQGGFERLKDIGNLRFKDSKNRTRPFLTASELKALSVSRGSLTAEEFAEIQSHVTHTYDFLRKIPWGKDLANVPHIAAKHHEKLDGSGYPTSSQAPEIPVQSRMMTIADIFDALTASDRPYKRAVPLERALDIIHAEVKSGKCDPELFRIFIESKCYKIVL